MHYHGTGSRFSKASPCVTFDVLAEKLFSSQVTALSRARFCVICEFQFETINVFIFGQKNLCRSNAKKHKKRQLET